MPALKWRFAGHVRDIIEPDRDRLFIAIGNKLHSLTQEVDDGNGGIEHEWATKRISGTTFYMLKRAALDASTDAEFPENTPINMYVNDKLYLKMIFGQGGGMPVYGNETPALNNTNAAMAIIQYANDLTKHQTLRGRTLQFRFSCPGCRPYTLSRFRIEIVPVGVVG